MAITQKKRDTFTAPQLRQTTPPLHHTTQNSLLTKILMRNSTPPVLYLPMLNTANLSFSLPLIMTSLLPDDERTSSKFKCVLRASYYTQKLFFFQDNIFSFFHLLKSYTFWLIFRFFQNLLYSEKESDLFVINGISIHTSLFYYKHVKNVQKKTIFYSG